MAIENGVGSLPLQLAPRPVESVRCFVRQPILDVRGRVHGYELIFRGGPQSYFRGDGDLATRSTLDGTVLFGLDRLTRGLPVFLKCTPEALTELLVEILLPSMTTLELQTAWFTGAKMIDLCRGLKRDGFRLALDRFCCQKGFEGLIEIADFIMVDLASLSESGRSYLRHHLRSTPATLVAINVHTREDYRAALNEGFTLFQGFYFCQVEAMKTATVPANFASHVTLLDYLHRDTLEINEVARILMLDTALTYRLLRLVNSALIAMRQEIRSIESALMIVGEEMFRRMATLAIATELGGGSTEELVQMALVRARFCDRAASEYALCGEEQYLLGMLSLVPAMLMVPMDDLLRNLPLRPAICDALRGVHNEERIALDCLESYERGDWAACDKMVAAHGLYVEELKDCFVEALHWAEAAVKVSR